MRAGDSSTPVPLARHRPSHVQKLRKEIEKQRVIGGGPKFRKFGRRVMYAVADLDVWAAERSFESTSDPEYAEQHAADSRAR